MSEYESPLFPFFSKIKNNNINLGYVGNLYQIFDELKQTQLCNSLIRLSPFHYTKNQVNIAFHPPRIIKRLLDFKISNSSKTTFKCLNDSVKAALLIYQNPRNSSIIVNNLDKLFKTNLSTSDYEDLMFSNLTQRIDNLSLKASNPQTTLQNSELLTKLTNNSEILFISLGYGGIMAGMDMYLNYINKFKTIKNYHNSNFHPARFSRYKLNDDIPKLSLEERCFLKMASKNKKIVVFDEDSCSGETLEQANSYFKNLFNRNDLICFANDFTDFKYDIKNQIKYNY